MSILNKVVVGALAVCVAAGAFGQTSVHPGKGLTKGTTLGGPHSSDGANQLTVPHLIYTSGSGGTGGDGGSGTLVSDGLVFRPEVINIDDLTIRKILSDCVTIDDSIIVQAVRLEKDTPMWKCTAFVSGPGSGLNTNFTTGFRKATNDDLDKSAVKVALGIPDDQVALGNRALLFSPPLTKYTIKVVYVIRDSNGRIGPPNVCVYYVQVKVPTRDDIAAAVDYFSEVAAGATQKPKITYWTAHLLYDALAIGDPLEALIAFEGVVGDRSIDFATMLAAGDVRFLHGYMIDDDEEPIGCLLIEMANAALWY